MKKEFKAPTVEAKNLSIQNSVMDGGMVLSIGYTQGNMELFNDEAVNDGFNRWKGFNK